MRNIVVCCTILSCGGAVSAANWPAWRGPTGQGFCEEKNLPLKWSAKDNVKWKVPLAHQGNSTPVIWGDKIFLTQANKGGSTRSLICFARKDGKLLWQKDIGFAGKEQNWTQDWYANASPALDSERVVVSFASAGMYCFDHDGKELWKRTDLGTWQHGFGSGSSPVLYGELAILWVGPNSDAAQKKDENVKKDEKAKKAKKAAGARNFLLAVDKKTGKTVWEHDEAHGSWSTPVIAKVDMKDQLLLANFKEAKDAADEDTGYLKGYDPKTGMEIWKCQGINSYVYTSALYGNGVAVVMSGYGGSALAVKLGGTGDITKDRLWKHPRNTQRVGSGMLIGDYVYMVDENAVAHCYEATTGKDVWQDKQRVGSSGKTWGSMVHSDGRLYLLMHGGDTVVLKASPKFEVLAVNSLGDGEQTNSSIAVSNGDIFIRTFKHLWCIGQR
jgi:outer membrane protein assembly factor BamB